MEQTTNKEIGEIKMNSANKTKKYDFSKIEEPIISEELEKKMPELVYGSQKVGSTLTFGQFTKSVGAVKTPLEWIILQEWIEHDNTEKYLVITKNALDIRSYDDSHKDITWADSSIRKWLNDDFYNSAFSPEEKKLIRPAWCCPDERQDFEEDTKDKVFLFSYYEARMVFSLRMSRYLKCTATEYAERKNSDAHGACRWWLRSPGSDYSKAAFVSADGEIQRDGINISSEIGVRPVMWVKKQI
ncbi:MAG: hypothetical protein J5585_01600 [Clostridia bacterium]|nr:hypothetical protein [Clostridia bacterium]